MHHEDMSTDRSSDERVAVAAARVLKRLNVDKRSNDRADRVIKAFGQGVKDGRSR